VFQTATARVCRRLTVTVSAALMAVCLAPAAIVGQKTAELRRFAGGIFEASGVVHVPGTSGVLFADDNRTREIFWMEIGPDGTARAPAAVALTEAIEDPEGLTSDGSHFYIVGSQSKGDGPAGAGLARFTFDHGGRRVERLETIPRLKAWLVEHVPEFEGLDAGSASDEFNIEGLAWDPAGTRLLLGFRRPLVDGQALIVPIALRAPQGAFTAANLRVDGRALRVALDGGGIRSLDYDPEAKTFLILSETPRDAGAFRLLAWRADTPDLRTLATFANSLQPEGVTRFSAGGVGGLFVVFDTSRYTLIR